MKKHNFIPKTLWICMLSAFCSMEIQAVSAQESEPLAIPSSAQTEASGAAMSPSASSMIPDQASPSGAPQGQAGSLQGTSKNPLQGSVIKGLERSAKLSGAIHDMEASMDDADGSFGALLPTVDLRGQAGRENSRISGGESRTYNNSSYGIEARQNIFNGFASQARYLGAYSVAMQRYYQALDQANQIAFDSSSAHVDVSRYQALTRLAEENLKYHQELMDKIQEKVNSGVTRQSDYEQAKSRYTLALSNLATEKANTFASMANYQRIVDEVWPVNQAGEYIVKANFEVDNPERLVYALNHHPLIKAANANTRAANEGITAASEGFYPRIDLRAKSDVYSNYLSTFEERQISSVDVLASMNLYRGGSDTAARSAATRRKLRSLDDKLLVCRTIRQSAQTSLYDVVSSQRKLNYFREQADAITRARAAYEQQFSIGRRSLLDLLSAENEYYQAQRALINIEADLSTAKLKLLATTGQLVELFGVENVLTINEPTKRQIMFYDEQVNQSADDACPASLINLDDFKLPNLGFDDALKSVNNDGTPALPVQPIQVAAANVGGESPALTDPSVVSKKLTDKTTNWAKAWETKNVNAYLGFYASNFKPENGSYEAWQNNRRQRVAAAKELKIGLSDFKVIPSFDEPDVYEITFIQDYKTPSYQEKSRKVLTWKLIQGDWQIVREQNLPASASYEPERKRLAMAN